MLPRRFAATVGALRAAGLPPTFMRLFSAASAAAPEAAGGAPPPPPAGAAAYAPPKNLRLDKATVRLVERLRAVEDGAFGGPSWSEQGEG
jgi:hypothetical protein